MSLDFNLYYDNDGNKITVFDANITHNLGKMASEAGIYICLWRPDENNFIYAKDMIELLEKGYDDMLKRPEYYEQFNSKNGWGVYEHFLPWVKKVLDACKQYPNAKIKVWR